MKDKKKKKTKNGKNLKDNYLYYKKKKGTIVQATHKYQNWPWANQLLFLNNRLALRQTVFSISQSSTELSLETEIQNLTPPPMTNFRLKDQLQFLKSKNRTIHI